jgi:hypothetical protein
MGTLTLDDRTVRYQWASDVAFDGICLEILSPEGKVCFDVSVPDKGPITVNTFGEQIEAVLIAAAVEVAQHWRLRH